MQPLGQWLDNNLRQSTQPLVLLMRKLTTAWKAVQSAQAVGDLSTLSNNLSQLKATLEQIHPMLDNAIITATTFDIKTYLDDLFDGEFRSACSASDLPLDGQYPRYIVYPIQVQVDGNRMGVLINRKLHRGLHISRIIEAIRSERARLLRRPFNAKSFLADVAAIYDGIVELETAKNQVEISGHEVGLRHLYQKLVPMRQWRNDYPEGSFAFDLHRVLRSGETHAPDGRRLRLAPARDPRNNIAVLDSSGHAVEVGLIGFRRD